MISSAAVWQRLKALTLAEVMLAMAILSVAVLTVAPLTYRLLRTVPGGDASNLHLFLAASQVVEKARLHLQQRDGAFDTLISQFDGKVFAFDSSGRETSGGGAVLCSVRALTEDSFPECGDSLVRLVVTARDNPETKRTYQLATMLAAPPPKEHCVYSGFLTSEGGGTEAHWDDYWGGYYGTTFAMRQSVANAVEAVDPANFPFPADPNGKVSPPEKPSPIPWGWK